jgi:enoyl-CoA hydratase/carnithine racemase
MGGMAYDTILYEQSGPVLTVTLNRPEKLNAYTVGMGLELADAFRRADEDDTVRAVIVTGAGRGFCAGADISSGADAFDSRAGSGSGVFGAQGSMTDDPAKRTRDHFIARIFNCRKPSICAINGAAVGVGITLTLPMDIRIAAQGAKIGFIFARRGLVPEAGSAWFLPRIVGMSTAMRWCLSGRMLSAEEALDGGLVSEVVAPDALLARARAIATEIAEETAPISIALTRQMLWRFSAEPDPFGLLAFDGPLSRDLGSSPDVKEGVRAFLEKRKPAFPGKVSTNMPKSYPWWRD